MDIVGYKLYLEKLGKSANTVLAYCKDVEIFADYIKGKGLASPEDVTSTEVVSYVLKLKSDNLAASSINRKLSSIRTYYTFLKDQGLIQDNPTRGIKSPKVKHKALEYLEIADMDKLLNMPDNSVKGIRDKAMLEVMYATGIRVSELIEIRMEDINIRMGMLVCSGSHGKARVVPLGRPAKAALEAYVYDVRSTLIGDGETDVLFVNYNGEPLTRQGLWKILKEYAKKAGLDAKFTPQTIRNSFAVHMLQNGADLKSLQELMGHEDIAATEVYLTFTKTRIKDVYDKTHPRA